MRTTKNSTRLTPPPLLPNYADIFFLIMILIIFLHYPAIIKKNSLNTYRIFLSQSRVKKPFPKIEAQKYKKWANWIVRVSSNSLNGRL